MEDVSHLLGEQVGDFDTDVYLICRESARSRSCLAWGEPVT